jgi:S-DNA-T family DNA segregation ATPase FtsK/SpoIIIE
MARRKQQKHDRKERTLPRSEERYETPPGVWGSLREETRHSIIGITFVLLALILVFAAVGHGGFLGGQIYGSLHFLFGIGYYAIPTLFVILGVNFFRARRNNVTTPSLIAGPFFLISALGLLALFDSTRGTEGFGGWVGYYIMAPMAFLFAPTLAGILLAAVLLVTVLFLFDTPLHLGFFRFIGSLLRREPKEGEGDELEEEAEPEVAAEVPREEEKISLLAKILPEKKPEEPAPIAPPTTPVGEPKEKAEAILFNLAQHRPFTPPPLSLLAGDKGKPSYGDIKANANIIKRTLQNYGIEVEMDEVSVGPSITRYTLKPAEGVRLSKIVALQRELEYALALAPIRIEAPIPGKSLVGIEIPNTVKSTVGLGSLLSDPTWGENVNPLYVPLGKGISGMAQFMNIAKAPHALVAGATGSGKSVTIHTIITSLLYRNSPEQLRFIMVDPKRVELTLYNGIPHLLTPVITDAKKAILTLKWAAKEMDRRYEILQEEKCRDIQSYHKNVLAPALKKFEKKQDGARARGEEVEELSEIGKNDEVPELMPYTVIVIDELADIMQAYPRELESAIVRLAQMSRAVGIHLLLSTQRPSVNVITGLIKANVPTRIALQVASQIDSRTILDMSGAENLLGAGDMLYLSADLPKPIRLQSAFISENEVKNVVKFLKDNYAGVLGGELNLSANADAPTTLYDGIPEEALMDAGKEDDEMYEEAKKIIVDSGKASTSFLQRRLGLGYARAARIMDILEERGVIGPADGAKPRDVLIKGSGNEGSGE